MENPTLLNLLNGQKSRVVGELVIKNLFDTEKFPLSLRKSGYGLITAYAKVNGKWIAIAGGFPDNLATWDGLVEYLKDDDTDDALTVTLKEELS